MDYEGWEAMDGELIRIVQRWRTTVAVSAALHDWHVWNTCLEFFHLLKRGWTATIICSSSWALSIGFLFMLNVKWILNVMFKPCKISPWGRLMKLCWQKKKKRVIVGYGSGFPSRLKSRLDPTTDEDMKRKNAQKRPAEKIDHHLTCSSERPESQAKQNTKPYYGAERNCQQPRQSLCWCRNVMMEEGGTKEKYLLTTSS